MVGEQLAISSKDLPKLEAVKDMLIDRGNTFIEERFKLGPKGEKIYTYLFIYIPSFFRGSWRSALAGWLARCVRGCLGKGKCRVESGIE